MLTTKWKIFRIVSYLHLTVTVLLTVICYFGLSQSSSLSMSNTEDVLGVLLLVVCPVILVSNSIVNLNLLDKYYPQHIPSRRHRIWSRILFVLALLLILILILLSLAAVVEMYDTRRSGESKWAFNLFMSFFFVISLTGIYILWNQVSLRKALHRNHQANMEYFLEDSEAQP